MTTGQNTHVLLVTNPANIRYLTGFVGVSETEREAYLLLTDKKRYLFTSALYLEETARLDDVEVIEISRDAPLSTAVSEVLKSTGSNTVEFEDTNLTVAEFTKLRDVLSPISLTGVRDRIERDRMIKREDELDHIRKAAALTDQCFTHVLRRIRPGITEARLAWEIEGYLRYRAGGMAFDPIVAFNQHSAMPHYHDRGDLPLRKGTIILLDFGARYHGYCADMTRTVFFGTPKPEWTRAYESVRTANETALTLLEKGERDGATLDTAARGVIAVSGLPVYPHSLGHAVGLEIHEAPRLTVKKPETLSPGMVITIEPGTYLPGRFGIRIEDLVQIRKTGITVLSRSSKEPIVIS